MKRTITLFLLIALIFVIISVRDTRENIALAEGTTPTLTSTIGTAFTYQGSLSQGGHPANGYYDFIFKLYDTQDIGTGALFGDFERYEKLVSDGLFTIELDFGDIFDGRAFWIEVSVRPSSGEEYTLLIPRQAVTATPYALYALGGPWSAGDGLELVDTEFRGKGTPYQNLVIVAKSGGDFTSIQAAIDSITDEAANNQYLVWVAPGVYSEIVTMKAYVHLQGAGQEATVITSSAYSTSSPASEATLTLASYSSLRDLTVGNNGSGSHNVALMAVKDTVNAQINDVIARAQGKGAGSTNNNYGIYLKGSNTHVTLQDVTALAENGVKNDGLLNTLGAETRLYGGSYTARGGILAFGIENAGSNSSLEASNITGLGVNGSGRSFAFYNISEGSARLYGGSFIGRGGDIAAGVVNDEGCVIHAINITALGESGIQKSYGFWNESALKSEINSSKITGSTYALYNGLALIYVGVTQLDGGVSNVMGAVNCFQVYDGGYHYYTCP